MRASTVGAVVAALSLVACGGSSKKEEPSAWARDPAHPRQVGVGDAGATGLVNGAADPFIAVGLVQLEIGGYVNTAAGETLYPVRYWQMQNAAAAQTVWNSLLSNSLYSSNTWDACASSVGEACRIADTGNAWWINTRKGAYHVEVTIRPKSATTSADALAYLAVLLAQLP